MKKDIFEDKIPKCSCGGYIKPDIVFFGEALPSIFFDAQDDDFETCDLLIVMGTSLSVRPFADLVSMPHDHVPRLLINREVVGPFKHPSARDVCLTGDIDEGVKKLASLLGWEKDLEDLFVSFKK